MAKKTITVDYDSLLESVKTEAYNEGYRKACSEMLAYVSVLLQIGTLSEEERFETVKEALKKHSDLMNLPTK